MRTQRASRTGRASRSSIAATGGGGGGGAALPVFGGTTPTNVATQLDYSISAFRQGVNVASGLGWADGSECVYMLWVNAATSSFGGWLGSSAFIDEPGSYSPYNLNPMTNIEPTVFPTNTPKIVGNGSVYSDGIIVAHDASLDNPANGSFPISYNSGVSNSSVLFGWNFEAGTFGGVSAVHVVDTQDDEDGFTYANPASPAATITFPATEIPAGQTFNYFIMANNDGITGGTWGGADATASTVEGSSAGGTDHHYFVMAVDGPVAAPDITFSGTNLHNYVGSANGVMAMVVAFSGV